MELLHKEKALDDVINLTKYPTKRKPKDECTVRRIWSLCNITVPREKNLKLWQAGVTSESTSFSSEEHCRKNFPLRTMEYDRITDKALPPDSESKKHLPTVYAHIKDQLAALGRQIDSVPPDGNCLFESIARQLEPSAMITSEALRCMACATARQSPERFECFMKADRKGFLKQINKLEKDKVWNIDVGDMAISMVQATLNRKVVVLRNSSRPQMFPDDGGAIDDGAIVIIQDDLRSHFDATTLMYWPNDFRAYGLAAQQAAFFGRVIDPIPPGGNCFFEAVRRQYKLGNHTKLSLRKLVSDHGQQNADKYSPEGDREAFTNHMLLLGDNGFWLEACEVIVIRILVELLKIKIVVIAQGVGPLHFPDDQRQIDDTAIILVKDHNSSHFDATTRRTDTSDSGGYGSIYEQLNEMDRELLPQKDEPYSIFCSLAAQPLPTPRVMDGPQLLRYVCEPTVANLQKSIEIYPSEKPKQKMLEDFKVLTRGEWRPELRDMVLSTVRDMLKIRIVVVHNYAKPQFIPEDDQPITESTVVIVQAHSKLYGTRFHSTEKTENIFSNYDQWKSQNEDIRQPPSRVLLCCGKFLESLFQPLNNALTNITSCRNRKQKVQESDENNIEKRCEQNIDTDLPTSTNKDTRGQLSETAALEDYQYDRETSKPWRSRADTLAEIELSEKIGNPRDIREMTPIMSQSSFDDSAAEDYDEKIGHKYNFS